MKTCKILWNGEKKNWILSSAPFWVACACCLCFTTQIQNIHASAMIFDSRNITEFCLVECNDYPSMDADHFYIFCKFISAFLIAYVCTFCEFSFRLVVTSYRFLH